MAGSEQRPTDDVLGHGAKRPEDETAGDRGKRNPDDTEGHMPLRRAVDTEATDEDQAGDDVAGHSAKVRLGQDTEATDDVQGHAGRYGGGHQHIDANDDVEGHMPFRNLDSEAVDEDQVGDDTEGHGVKFRP